GAPGALLNANNDNNLVSPNQWNNISITSTPVTSGTAYWLGAITDTNSVTRVTTPNPRRYKAQAYAGFNWPGSLTGLTTADNVFLCIAGWSTTGPAPLSITTNTLPDGTVDVPYSQTLQATGGTGSYTWSTTSGSLPAGLSLNTSTGLISGTPTAAGTANFTAQVTDSASATDTQALSITINSPPPLNITTASLPDGNVGSAYSQTLQATGGTGSYNWSITSGSLPAGLSLTQSSGLISGTPTAAATSNFTVQVNDGSTTASKPLSITINPAGTTQKLVGTDTSGTETVSPNYIQLSKFTAAATGTVSQIKVYSTASAHVKVAIYADNAGAPGALLNANNDNNPVSPNQWNNISITSTPVTSGTAYWLGAIMDTYSVTRVTTPNPRRYKAQAYAGFNWPGSLTGLSTSDNMYLCIAGWSVVSPPTLPDPPSLLSPGATITFKWGTSTGATTYWLQVNTASDFTGTNMFNSEVGNITSQEVAGLSLGTAYYWRVKAGNSSGWSNWSSVRSVLANTVP
ncbi:MAG: Ig domain-containing protein, partial [Desulfobacterales bacterium]|nr:Ig domain-containing protein [Desulfobacterales bacterium]